MALAEVVAEETERGLDAESAAAKERAFLEATRAGRHDVGSRPVGADPVAIAEARLQAAQDRLAEQVAAKREQIAVMRERLIAKCGSRLELDHYLEALVHKPGALAGATALEQARQAGTFTPTHEAWWAAARKAHGEAAGTRELIEVLLLHRHMAHHHVVAGIAAALTVGALSADVVALEARKIAQADEPPASDPPEPRPEHLAWLDEPAVVSLTSKRLAQLPPDTRPLPSAAVYDQLLRRRSSGAQPASEGEPP
ncbi:hypothetical protein ACIBKY_04940 [Nonomuraea sp. NPDC050394]|uniref:hypothetical protein n=1 Tax=Nonomuraea sp. NPDC050394 TaxID=3364363 RepID=UPI0037A8D0CF